MQDDKDSRRRFLAKAMKALLAVPVLKSLCTDVSSGESRPRRVSWREAMHYTKIRKPVG